jgi:hypothetical protein
MRNCHGDFCFATLRQAQCGLRHGGTVKKFPKKHSGQLIICEICENLWLYPQRSKTNPRRFLLRSFFALVLTSSTRFSIHSNFHRVHFELPRSGFFY